ncbi:hypothetical protein [Gordonia malaquae]|uniref:hypothetical protein n=1 Tax=Gordonia malaquae TaxID=410332 RepID=UPI003016C873
MSNSVGTAIGPCETMLFRQIHPLLIKGGSPSRGAFLPGCEHEIEVGKSNFKPESGNDLSTRHEDIGAEGAFLAHRASGLKTLGTWGFQVKEAAELGLSCHEDAGLGQPPAPEHHVTVMFPDVPDRKKERIARSLKSCAAAHGRGGWLHGPVDPEA